LPSAFVHAALVWLKVMQGGGRRLGHPLAATTAYHYINRAAKTLRSWAAAGITGPQEVTREHIEDALDAAQAGESRRDLHTGPALPVQSPQGSKPSNGSC
jgi:hypothetical protein